MSDKQSRYKIDKETGKCLTGRPSKYDPKYCKEIIDFFSISPYKEIPVITTLKDGTTKEEYKQVPNDIRFLSSFARHIGVSTSTLYEWENTYPEFSGALKIAKELQEEFLIQNGLNGNYNPTFAIFTAKNLTTMRDSVETTHNVNINVTDYLQQIPERTTQIIDADFEEIEE